MRIALFLSLLGISTVVCAQLNCNVYKEDKACYDACNMAVEAGNYQGLRQSQQGFDKAIELCATLSYSWSEKSVPYLKRGLFVEWKKLMDKAVEIDPLQHLGYRGWCRYQFLRDYRGAIADLERLDAFTQFDIGYSVNGDYHLQIALALCYKALGENRKALEIVENHMQSKNYVRGPYDLLHLGVIKLTLNDYKGAIEAFNKQIAYNDFQAENYFYLAKVFEAMGDKVSAMDNVQKAKNYYLSGKHLFDPYTHQADRIFLSDIETFLQRVSQ